MSITLLQKPLSAAHASSGPIMVLGLTDRAGDVALCVNGDGEVVFVPLDGIRIDWRYDWRTNQWVDVTLFGDEIEEDDGEPADETTDHGSASVP